MLIAGLTGNMGSGKSTVARIFSTLHIPVYHADDAAKRFYRDPDVIRKVDSLTQGAVTDTQGDIDLKKLAGVIFQDPVLLRQLSELIHPLVMQDFRLWVSRQSSVPYVIQETAILFEEGLQSQYDKVIHVSCPYEITLKRILNRDRLTDEAIRQRTQWQWPDERKVALSDWVIVNDGMTLVIPQVLSIHKQLCT